MNNKTNEKVRIRLESFNHELLVSSCRKITQTLSPTAVNSVGMVTLPTSKRIYCVLRSPHVNKKAREQFQLCAYKRLMDIYSSSSKTIDALMKLELPSGVDVEIKV